MDTQSSIGGALMPSGVGRQPKNYKVGEVIQLVVHGYGGFSPYFEDMVLNPQDRLIEVEIKSVKAVKKQEFIDA